jgi:hypothetical protein
LANGEPSWLDARVTLPPVLSQLPHWLHRAGGWLGWCEVKRGVLTAAHRTGIPAVLVAALALVVAFRLARRALHLVFEVTLALALVLAATKAGWIRF